MAIEFDQQIFNPLEVVEENDEEPPLMQRDTAMLVLHQGLQSPRKWPLSRNRPIVIGRSDTCDVVLADRQVSRFHARISWDGQQYVIEDLGSKNGTHVNGESPQGAIPLADGDEFQIGIRFKLAFVDDGATAPLALETEKGLSLDKGSRTLHIGKKVVSPPLSLPQYLLLELLWDADGRIVTRDEIVNVVWSADNFEGISEQAIDALVRRLRERIAEIDAKTDYIITVRGHGFRLINCT